MLDRKKDNEGKQTRVTSDSTETPVTSDSTNSTQYSLDGLEKYYSFLFWEKKGPKRNICTSPDVNIKGSTSEVDESKAKSPEKPESTTLADEVTLSSALDNLTVEAEHLDVEHVEQVEHIDAGMDIGNPQLDQVKILLKFRICSFGRICIRGVSLLLFSLSATNPNAVGP